MKRKPLLTVPAMVLAALMWLAVPVQGAEYPESEQPPSFSKLDANKDQHLTAEEAVVVPGLAGQLTTLDVNSDGNISKEEYAKYAARPSVAPDEL